jgi:hypothetical protein
MKKICGSLLFLPSSSVFKCVQKPIVQVVKQLATPQIRRVTGNSAQPEKENDPRASRTPNSATSLLRSQSQEARVMTAFQLWQSGRLGIVHAEQAWPPLAMILPRKFFPNHLNRKYHSAGIPEVHKKLVDPK